MLKNQTTAMNGMRIISVQKAFHLTGTTIYNAYSPVKMISYSSGRAYGGEYWQKNKRTSGLNSRVGYETNFHNRMSSKDVNTTREDRILNSFRLCGNYKEFSQWVKAMVPSNTCGDYSTYWSSVSISKKIELDMKTEEIHIIKKSGQLQQAEANMKDQKMIWCN